METINIQVAPEIAKAYVEVSPAQEAKIQAFLKVMFTKQKSLSEIMDQIADEAAANGMTPEILESILADES